MRIRFLCLLLFLIGRAGAASANGTATESLDLNDNEYYGILRKSVFTKINTILDETIKLRESQNSLSESLVKINTRLDAQDLKFTELMEITQRQLTDLKKEQDIQTLKLTNSVEKTQMILTDLKTDHDAQERNLTQIVKSYFSTNHEWITILRRQDGSVDFYRNWTEYQKGFGNPDGEFFIGLEKLHAMTSLGAPQELMVVLKDFENNTRIAKYFRFEIGNERRQYALTLLGTYSGDAGDSLSYHTDLKFSTYDRDNDLDKRSSCAEQYKGAWWFKECYDSHLFGPYRTEENAADYGVAWNSWKGDRYSLKFAEMKIRSIYI